MHLEIDAAKTLRSNDGWNIDYNRSGAPLVEIVTLPDFTDPKHAIDFLKYLRQEVISMGSAHADMFQGDMRFDVNVS
jgi:aspartyl-tRNA(Asn)/glutamyl-tRNA(Gln) amidotransferase subunit B